MRSVPALPGNGFRAVRLSPGMSPPLIPPAVVVLVTAPSEAPPVGVKTDETALVPGVYVKAYVPLWICPTGWPVREPIQGLVASLVSAVVEFRQASTWKTACGLVCSALVSLFVSTVRWLVDPAAAP